MVEGQCSTYLRLTRVSSGPQASVTKTYRDETKMKISAKSQWPSSAVEYKRLKRYFLASLKLHTNLSSNHDTTPVSISVNPPHCTLASAAFKKYRFNLLYSTAEEGHWDLPEIFIFVSSLYVLATLTCRPDDALVSLR